MLFNDLNQIYRLKGNIYSFFIIYYLHYKLPKLLFVFTISLKLECQGVKGWRYLGFGIVIVLNSNEVIFNEKDISVVLNCLLFLQCEFLYPLILQDHTYFLFATGWCGAANLVWILVIKDLNSLAKIEYSLRIKPYESDIAIDCQFRYKPFSFYFMSFEYFISIWILFVWVIPHLEYLNVFQIYVWKSVMLPEVHVLFFRSISWIVGLWECIILYIVTYNKIHFF